jgi:uncharacterized membrane protein
MIVDGFSYLAVLALLVAVVVGLERKYKDSSFFSYVPAIVVIYFGCMLCSTFGVWTKTEAINATYKSLKGAILPTMLFVMLIRCDLRKIARLGGRMLLAFVVAATSIGLGFIVTYALLQSWYEPDTWKAFAALCGSWMGGTGNMVAVQGALAVPEAKMGYALLMDSINYAVWVMLLLAMVPFAKRFNHWAGADTQALDQVGAALAKQRESERTTVEFADLMVLLGAALAAAALARWLGALAPTSDFFSATTWTVVIVSLLGIGAALTRLGTLPGASELGNVFLYMLVALIASRANFAELEQAPVYIVSGFLILGIHGLLMVIAARLFRLDLFTLGVASLANIGGVASAPILAAAYSEVLIPIGILMAMLGYVVGTYGGLLVGSCLAAL